MEIPLPTPFAPASHPAAATEHVFIIILVVSAAVVGLVTVLVLYASYRFRAKPGQPEPRKNFGVRWLERTWTLLPLMLLASMFGLTVVTSKDTDPWAPMHQPDLLVVGHQWWWEARYLHSGAVTATEIVIPLNKPLITLIETVDVIHDFWVPQLARKMDATPGYPTTIWLSATVPGTYLGTCSEFCGAQHAWMRFRVIAKPQAEFDAWQKWQAQPAIQPQGDLQKYGALVFQQNTCTNCHTIRGTAAEGKIGPDLTHVASRGELAGERLKNTPDNLFLWIKNPQTIKPGVRMPNMQLSDDKIHALVAYLEALK